jgi:uncharacterized membrane protein
MDENLVLVTFDDDSQAFEGLALIKHLGDNAQIQLHEAGVVERAQSGELKPLDQTDSHVGLGFPVGGVVGALVGILGGPVGMLLGGGLGAAAGGAVDIEKAADADDDLVQVARKIPNGKTALIAAAGEVSPEPVDAAMQTLGGTVTRYARKDIEEQVAAAKQSGHERLTKH